MPRLTALLAIVLGAAANTAWAEGVPPAGVVSYVKVVSDKVPDVSNMEAWLKSTIRPGMTDAEKALAVWKSVYQFQHQDNPPNEFLQHENVVQDPFKVMNVYGYAFCSVASCSIEALSRQVGLEARGRIINSHSVPEVKYDGAWHLMDASLITLFPKADGQIASVDEIIADVKAWYAKNPEYKKDDKKLRDFMRAGGWRKGPDVLTRTKAYDDNGWLPAATHGWYSTMQEYDGSHDGIYEYGYSLGYQVNVQLRPGERLVRNWSNKGLHVNMKDGGEPGCLKQKVGEGALRYTPADGDIAPGRVGNGRHEWKVPVSRRFNEVVLDQSNLEPRAGGLGVKDPTKPGTFTLRMPSSYVYLTGTLKVGISPATKPGSVTVEFSDNNGLDWKEIGKSEGKELAVDLSPLVLRRYDYRLRFTLTGREVTSVDIGHDIQHSQRSLPALGQGANTITFSTGPSEGTITVEGSTNLESKGKQLIYTDFHPKVEGIGPPNLLIQGSAGAITFPIATPGDMVRLRFGAMYRARDARDGWDYEVSFDGQNFKKVSRASGPTPGHCHYVKFTDVPPKTRQAWVRFSGTNRNATMLHNVRIDADYQEPFGGGYSDVKVTYQWDENGQPKEHVSKDVQSLRNYKIECAAKPVMKSLIVERE